MDQIHLTNLLGHIIGKNKIQFNVDTKTVDSVVSKELFYKWEAQLCQCAALSRLMYCPTEIFLRGVQFLEYAPDIMTDIITQLEHSLYSRYKFSRLFLSNNIPPEANKQFGKFFPRAGCCVFQYHNTDSKINSQKTLYVVFKGSSSLRDLKNDLNLSKLALKEIEELSGLSGTTHKGFYDHMRPEVQEILKTVFQLCKPMERIVVTGHSLGGAMSTLFSLMIVHSKEVNIPVHCVTFGAPNLLSDEARNEYNSHLLNGSLTLDRVTAETKGVLGMLKPFTGVTLIDIVPLLPGISFSHPGYTILSTEQYATSKTGRAKDIDDIRGVFIGHVNVVRRAEAGPHELPADPAFWNLFTHLIEDADLTTRLKKYGRLKRYNDPRFVQFVLDDLIVNKEDMQPVLTELEESLLNARDVKESSETTKALVENVKAISVQTGGALTFGSVEAAKKYKEQALSAFPNRVNYQCYKYLGAGSCHAAYMGIGFVNAVRFPQIKYRDSKGKLRITIFRKLEPTNTTTLVGNAFSPAVRYYAVRRRATATRRARGNKSFRKTRK